MKLSSQSSTHTESWWLGCLAAAVVLILLAGCAGPLAPSSKDVSAKPSADKQAVDDDSLPSAKEAGLAEAE